MRAVDLDFHLVGVDAINGRGIDLREHGGIKTLKGSSLKANVRREIDGRELPLEKSSESRRNAGRRWCQFVSFLFFKASPYFSRNSAASRFRTDNNCSLDT